MSKSGKGVGVPQGSATDDHESVSEAVAHRRSRALGIATTLVLTACAVQLFAIQIIRGPALAEQGRQVRTSVSKFDAPRGSIVDSAGHVLVESKETYHIAVNQQHIRDWVHYDADIKINGKPKIIGTGAEDAAAQLAPLLKMDRSELGGMMLGDESYVYLARNVDVLTYRKIRAMGIRGIEWEPVYERIYPGGNTAASVLGSIDADGKGDSGLELMYNKLMTGTSGEDSYEIGPTGAVIPGAKVTSLEAIPGATINTTLNSDLSTLVGQDLDEAVKKSKAQWGAVVVLDVATSKVLVLADSGLQSPAKGPHASRAVQMVFEPGSVGKVITVASAIEAGKVTPTTVLTIPERYTTKDGETFTDLHDHATYKRTVAGVLTESSNTGAVKIGETVSAKQLHQTMTDLGLGAPTGIELPGESAGLLSDPDDWTARGRYTPMFGQGYAVTAVQEATMMAAIGNKGVWQAPRVVAGYTRADGTFVEAETPEPRQALDEDTTKQLLLMMESVASDKKVGTGTAAAVDGYRIAIKTGTSELPKAEGGGTVATVAGVLPADNPQLAIAVVLYDPKIGVLSSDSAAPLFQKVAANSVRILGIPASGSKAKLYPTAP